MNPIPNIAKADSYKYSHYLQYRPGTEYVTSYIESRGCERDWTQVVNAGSVYLLESYLKQPLVTEKSLGRMKKRFPAHGPSFNREGWEDLLALHNGMAPVRVQALPEGLVVPLGTPQLQIVNTDRRFPWLPSFMETHILRSIWYPSTVATLSFHIKQIIAKYMDETAGHREGLDFKLHDFGSRGASSSESAQIGGLAHLYNFQGSDTYEAIELAYELYGIDMAAFSVDAAEHSTVTSFGGPEHELAAYEHLLETFGKGSNKIFSVVSDSYDLWNAVDNLWGDALKAKVEDLGTRNTKLVVRPDSGDPTRVPVETIQRLMDKFGHTINQKGYKVLPPYIGVLQGDGINEKSIEQILQNMKEVGLSAENIVFGMGGELLQKVNRDTLNYAMKASGAKGSFNNGEWYDVFKDPVTDSGKRSKKGRLAVVKRGGEIVTIRESELGRGEENLLQDIYKNGYGAGDASGVTLPQVRERINAAL